MIRFFIFIISTMLKKLNILYLKIPYNKKLNYTIKMELPTYLSNQTGSSLDGEAYCLNYDTNEFLHITSGGLSCDRIYGTFKIMPNNIIQFIATHEENYVYDEPEKEIYKYKIFDITNDNKDKIMKMLRPAYDEFKLSKQAIFFLNINGDNDLEIDNLNIDQIVEKFNEKIDIDAYDNKKYSVHKYGFNIFAH